MSFNIFGGKVEDEIHAESFADMIFCFLLSSDTKSILRCFSHQASDQLAFVIGQSSRSTDNLCPLPSVIINEVNVVSMGEDVGEYVELSSTGVPYFPLNNLYLVSLSQC